MAQPQEADVLMNYPNAKEQLAGAGYLPITGQRLSLLPGVGPFCFPAISWKRSSAPGKKFRLPTPSPLPERDPGQRPPWPPRRGSRQS